jgi:hypothetical protein
VGATADSDSTSRPDAASASTPETEPEIGADGLPALTRTHREGERSAAPLQAT